MKKSRQQTRLPVIIIFSEFVVYRKSKLCCCCSRQNNLKVFQSGNEEKFYFGSAVLVGIIGTSGKHPLSRRLIKESMVNFYRFFKLEAISYDSKLITLNKTNLWQGSGVFWSIRLHLETAGKKGNAPSPFLLLVGTEALSPRLIFFVAVFIFFLYMKVLILKREHKRTGKPSNCFTSTAIWLL